MENRLFRYLKETFFTGKRAAHAQGPFNQKDIGFFSEGAAELSRRFTSERSELKGDYLIRPELRAGYLLYFLPINFTKAAFVFQQLPKKFWQRPSFRILDLGCGPATASLAFTNELYDQNPEAEVEIDLIDQNKGILKDGQKLLKGFAEDLKFSKPLRIQTFPYNVTRLRLKKNYDLIILHHVLNEFSRWGGKERSEWLLPLLQHHLKAEGLLLAIEPALKRPGRELMSLRDHLLEEGTFRVLSPCLHEEICPMLAGTKQDWCHFYVNWQEPEYLKQVDRLLGNENRFLKLSYLLLGWSPAWKETFPEREKYFRVVSNRMATRGKTEVILCGKPGRIRATRLDRHRGKNNEVLDQIARGDLVEIPGFKEKGFTVEGDFRLGPGEIFLKR